MAEENWTKTFCISLHLHCTEIHALPVVIGHRHTRGQKQPGSAL